MSTPPSLRCPAPVLGCGLLALLTLVCPGQITLPAPIPGAFQDFEAVNEGELPAGWSVVNYTTEETIDPNLDDPHSSSYEDWVVISRDRLIAIGAAGGWGDQPEGTDRRLAVAPGQTVNSTPITQLLTGKFIYAESDQRGGNQVQYLFSPDFNCAGKVGVTLVFYSAYEQNQDSLAATEYSVDEGAHWLPVAYFLDGPDIIRVPPNTGPIDAVATMTTTDNEAATYTDDLGEFHNTYGGFIAAPIEPELAPFIQARVNDNETESKRVEVYRLSQADNKPKVRLRFAQAGTGSWYWGLDNIGLYAVPLHPDPARPTLTAPATAPFFSNTPVTLTGSAFSAPEGVQTHALSVWQVAVAGSFSADTGFQAPLIEFPSGTQLTSLSLSLDRFFPGQVVQFSVRYQDQFGTKSQFAAPQTLTMGTTFPALVPGSFEDFEAAAEGETPAGWELTNQSDPVGFPDWVVVSQATLEGFPSDRTTVPEVYSGNTLFGLSDGQDANVIEYATTPEYDLSGYTQVWVAYKSNYQQNQDSFGGLEFTTNDGVSWNPVVYMIDQADIKLVGGSVNALATLTTPYGDLAKILLEDGVTRVDAGKYGDFLLARPFDGLGPFISGRFNDDEVESKRYQRYRVAGADNQAHVKFRFTHTGTNSWFWGIDDFGLYSFSPPTPSSNLRFTSVRYVIPGNVGAPSVEMKWTSIAGKKYTVQHSLDLKTWPNLATNVDATGTETTYTYAPATEAAHYFRVKEQP